MIILLLLLHDKITEFRLVERSTIILLNKLSLGFDWSKHIEYGASIASCLLTFRSTSDFRNATRIEPTQK
jgi:hypothetical protein